MHNEPNITILPGARFRLGAGVYDLVTKTPRYSFENLGRN